MEKIKAICLLSGGLDSILAAKVISDLGIECTGLYFTSCFWSSSEKEKNIIAKTADEIGIKLKIVPVDEGYMEIIKNPKYGHGKGINPCVDCKIYMLKKAKKIMQETGAHFLVTGEVIGQRPMSQHRSALNYIEKEAEVRGILVRPLSGKLMKKTEPEEKGWLDSEKLLDISGRSRKRQMELAKEYKLEIYTSPAGGCLLTDKNYAAKLWDMFNHNEQLTIADAMIVKYGRHFRYNDNKIIVGRNRSENEMLLKIKYEDDYIFCVPDCGSPDVILQGEKTDESVKLAAQLTAYFSDNNDANVKVQYGENKLEKEIIINQMTKEEVENLRV